jgi:hypothetical protein
MGSEYWEMLVMTPEWEDDEDVTLDLDALACLNAALQWHWWHCVWMPRLAGWYFHILGVSDKGGILHPHIAQIAILIWREHDERVDIRVHPYFQTNSYKIRMFDPTFDDDPHWLCSNIVMGCSLQQPGREEKLRKVGDGSPVAVCFFPSCW